MLQIEAPRKDYKEYMIHHINTLLLISLSYCCNFTGVGNAVFVSMDLPDVLLCVSIQRVAFAEGLMIDMLYSWQRPCTTSTTA